MSRRLEPISVNALRTSLPRAVLGLLAAVLVAAGVCPARGQQQPAPSLPMVQASKQLELVITGPEAVPIPRRDWRQRFTAVLINRSNETVVFVPPRNDWYGERRLEWQALDARGEWLDRHPNYAIECDVHGVMRSVPDLAPPILLAEPPKQIRDADLVVLQPGDSYAIKSLADPWFALNFRRHGVYTLSLRFSPASEHYALPKNSRYAAALEKTQSLDVTSNTLTLSVN